MLLVCFAEFGLLLLSTGVVADAKVNANSAETVSPFTEMQMVVSTLQCLMNKPAKIIKEASPINQVTKRKQGCIQQASEVIHSEEELNPKQNAFLQKPKPAINRGDSTWYANKPVGVSKLSLMMKKIFVGAALSKVYTNHRVRATAITIWSDAEIPARHIMVISGHANEQSIARYNTRPSAQQLERCSDVLSRAYHVEKEKNLLNTPPERWLKSPLRLSIHAQLRRQHSPVLSGFLLHPVLSTSFQTWMRFAIIVAFPETQTHMLFLNESEGSWVANFFYEFKMCRFYSSSDL